VRNAGELIQMFDDFSRFAESHAAEIADAVPVGIAITGSLGSLVFVNAPLMTGYERGELLSQPVDLLLPERFRAAHIAHRKGHVVGDCSPSTRPAARTTTDRPRTGTATRNAGRWHPSLNAACCWCQCEQKVPLTMSRAVL
jgi:hypothetical protein